MNNLTINNFFTKVFGKLSFGLLLTFVLSFLILTNTTIFSFLVDPTTSYLVLIGLVVEVAVVWFLSARINKMSASTSNLVFYFYCLLNGITMPLIFAAYTPNSVIAVFFVASIIFFVMYLVGKISGVNILNYGPLFMFTLIGLVLCIFINIFLHSPALDFAITIIGVGVFIGLIVYDTKKFQVMYQTLETSNGPDRVESEKRLVVMAALSFYLDFINLFIYLLRLLGKRK